MRVKWVWISEGRGDLVGIFSVELRKAWVGA